MVCTRCEKPLGVKMTATVATWACSGFLGSWCGGCRQGGVPELLQARQHLKRRYSGLQGATSLNRRHEAGVAYCRDTLWNTRSSPCCWAHCRCSRQIRHTPYSYQHKRRCAGRTSAPTPASIFPGNIRAWSSSATLAAPNGDSRRCRERR